ncbi:MAG TPA: hypothetical protein VIL50_08030, partial [Candidatus Limnocylindrales bacterium]
MIKGPRTRPPVVRSHPPSRTLGRDRPTQSAGGGGERVTQGPIENPVINSPYIEPAQHFVT